MHRVRRHDMFKLSAIMVFDRELLSCFYNWEALNKADNIIIGQERKPLLQYVLCGETAGCILLHRESLIYYLYLK